MKYGIVVNIDEPNIQVKPINNDDDDELVVITGTTLQCSELEELLNENDSEEPILVLFDEEKNVLIEE